tara:strand:- start:240 stop:632 length:393 start_codon:yes stop_codon:yes gene_type:complete
MAKHNIKQKFYEAFRDNIGKEYVEENSDSNAEDKIKKLSNALGDAVIDWVLEQPFTVTNLKASVVGLTTTPSVPGAPSGIINPDGKPGIATVSAVAPTEGVSATNPLAAAESQTSTVQLLRQNAIGTEDV